MGDQLSAAILADVWDGVEAGEEAELQHFALWERGDGHGDGTGGDSEPWGAWVTRTVFSLELPKFERMVSPADLKALPSKAAWMISRWISSLSTSTRQPGRRAGDRGLS